MKYLLVALFLFIGSIAQAFDPVFVEVDKPFEEITISMDTLGQNQSYLGVLKDFPHLFEFTLEEETTLQIQVRQRALTDAQAVNLILLSVDTTTNRISEIVRVNEPITERNERYFAERSISLLESRLLEENLKPGLYRLEVSTAVNRDAYELDFGVESNSSGYFGMFGSIIEVQRHFGYPWFHFFYSSFVLYHIGIFLLIAGITYTWYRQKYKKIDAA